MDSSDRWPAILLQLHRDGWHRATDLAAAVGVSQRTIYRDMDALKDAGVPLRAVPGQGYTLDDDFLLDPIEWTTDEAAMLLLGSTLAVEHLGGRYRAAAQTARRQLEAHLPEDIIERVGTLRSGLRLVPEETFGGAANEQMLARLRQALLEERVIEFEERRPHQSNRRCTMQPYGLMRQGGNWHLVGRSPDTNRVRSVQLDRMRALTLRDTTFERPDGYRTSLDSTLPHQTVRVLFAPDVASSVQPAPSVTVESTERRPDGRLLMTLRVTREQDIVPWLLSWGAQAHVLEPGVLRRRLGREARQIAHQYQESPTLIE